MTIYLVHHAPAVEPEADPQRPLSAEGWAHAERLAVEARAAGVAPATIWHSGKLRARQTAEAFLRHCNPFATFKMVRGLRPGDRAEGLRDELEAETADLMIVSHMPPLPELARMLCPAVTEFPLHGLLALERKEAGQYVEVLRFG
jgi:phosphohistidine phosphatase